MENKAIRWGNGHCYRDISPTLSTDLSVCPLSSSGSAVISRGPYIVNAFVHKDAMFYHSITHKPGCIVSACLSRLVYSYRLGGA